MQSGHYIDYGASEMSDKSEFQSLTGQLLIATPALLDPNFEGAVCLVCEHSPEGAMGVVVNRHTELTLDDIYADLDLPSGSPSGKRAVLSGGPVSVERGFLLHDDVSDSWQGSLPVCPFASITASRDILTALAENHGPDGYQMILGYAGWGAGQLEQEIAENAWLLAPATHELLFETPFEQRYRAAANLVGVDISRLAPSVGHA